MPDTPEINAINHANDLDNRILWMDGEVDESWLEKAKQIIRWNEEDKALFPPQRQPIKLFFFSPGGSADIGRTLIDVITASVTPISAINLGMCASAAALVYLACDERAALKHSFFMFHKGSLTDCSGDFGTINHFVDKWNFDITQDIEYIAERTELPKQKVEKCIAQDWYLSAQEAVNGGVCQRIVKDLLTGLHGDLED